MNQTKLVNSETSFWFRPRRKPDSRSHERKHVFDQPEGFCRLHWPELHSTSLYPDSILSTCPILMWEYCLVPLPPGSCISIPLSRNTFLLHTTCIRLSPRFGTSRSGWRVCWKFAIYPSFQSGLLKYGHFVPYSTPLQSKWVKNRDCTQLSQTAHL